MLPKTLSAWIILFLLYGNEVECYSASVTENPQNVVKHRQKRLWNGYFPYNTCYALAVVLVLPLDLGPNRSVFFSYNFETNYYFPYFDKQSGIVPLPFSYIVDPATNAGTLHRVELPPISRTFTGEEKVVENDEQQNQTSNTIDGKNEEKEARTNGTSQDKVDVSNIGKKQTEKKDKVKKPKNKPRSIRSLLKNYFMSRRRFFKMLVSQMERSGLNGNECLLKAICETSKDQFGHHNGVLGSLADVLFLPSASKDEKLPKRYYQAEENGKLRKCDMYNQGCPKSIFDYVTKII